MIRHRHFILNKPKGYLSQFVFNQPKRRNKKLLGDLYDFPEGTMAIGRLDKNSEGLLLMTTDGKLSEQVRSKEVEKEYFVELDGEITEEAIEQLRQGVKIVLKESKHITLPCRAIRLKDAPGIEFDLQNLTRKRHRPSSWLSITITEGKFRQIRKMTAVVGFPTLRLIRVRIGGIKLKGIAPGGLLELENLNLALKKGE